MPLNGKKLSIHSVGTLVIIGGTAHPAVYDPEANQRWYWPNVAHQDPAEATEWAQHAIGRAIMENVNAVAFTGFHEAAARWNIYPVE